MAVEWADEIAAGILELGIELRPGQIAQLVTHLELLESASRIMNLTSVPTVDYASLHVLDSLTAAPFLAEAPNGAFVDLGSGAGFPGVPLAVYSGRPVELVEATQRKACFLRDVVTDLRLKATVRDIRAEEAALGLGGAFAAAVARAVTALPSLVELAAPLMSPGGHLLCLKGDVGDEERGRGIAAAALVGLRESGCERVCVPGLDVVRTIVVYERVDESSVGLPRRPGMAQRHPLA